jgi:LysW-gamma-L-lysine carboxypeptidase
MLGHMDTVPYHWPASWKDGELSGRGSVDAKASLANFLETLAELDIPDGCQVRVVGAVEEEVSSSKGAFHVRDHYPADAVIVGEPSGAGALTLGYFGLFKLRVTVRSPAGHSAGRNALSAPDTLIGVLRNVRDTMLNLQPGLISAVIDLWSEQLPDLHRAGAVLNFRLPPGTNLDAARAAAEGCAGGDVTIDVERCTPGYSGGRSSDLARAFARAFGRNELRPRYLVKKGTSDMNTLATTWRGVPMVAYGPGDSTLDHTSTERISAEEYLLARKVLTDAVTTWLGAAGAADE